MPRPRSKNTEVVASAGNDDHQRRRFTAQEKARILAEADSCTGRGEIGELLRREGISSSHLARWRAARAKEGAVGLVSQRPGPKPSKDAKDRRIEKLERENAELKTRNTDRRSGTRSEGPEHGPKVRNTDRRSGTRAEQRCVDARGELGVTAFLRAHAHSSGAANQCAGLQFQIPDAAVRCEG